MGLYSYGSFGTTSFQLMGFLWGMAFACVCLINEVVIDWIKFGCQNPVNKQHLFGFLIGLNKHRLRHDVVFAESMSSRLGAVC